MKHTTIFQSIITAIIGIVVIFLIVAGIKAAINWEDSQVNYEDGFVEYEVVIWNNHDVILYNSNDVSDSIHLRLENSYNLVGEQMIEIHK